MIEGGFFMFDIFITKVEDSYSLTTLGSITSWALFAIILLTSVFFFSKGKKTKFSTKQLAFCGISMALALATSYLEVYSFPFGGSVTLMSMLFICFIGYLYGAKVSIPVAIAYGILQLIIKPQIYFPLQIIIDYPLAFGALGLAGFFSKSRHGLVKGYIVGIVGRWVVASISGYIFFAEYAWEGWHPLPYTLAYNGAYIFTEGVVTIILLLLPVVYKAFDEVKKMAS
jgi:thiamine transporter